MRVLQDEFNIEIDRVSKADCPAWCGDPHPMSWRPEQKSWGLLSGCLGGRENFSHLTAFGLEPCYCPQALTLGPDLHHWLSWVSSLTDRPWAFSASIILWASSLWLIYLCLSFLCLSVFMCLLLVLFLWRTLTNTTTRARKISVQRPNKSTLPLKII